MMRKDCLTQLPLLQFSKIFNAFDLVQFIYGKHSLQQSAFSWGGFLFHFHKNLISLYQQTLLFELHYEFLPLTFFLCQIRKIVLKL